MQTPTCWAYLGSEMGKHRDILESVVETESEKDSNKKNWSLDHRLEYVCFKEFHL